MDNRYDEDSESRSYPWLEEFLCDYVDGTMDPAARIAFEEYLLANPDLAEHVRCLCAARQLLCSYGCRRQADGVARHCLTEALHRAMEESADCPDRTRALLSVFSDHLGQATMWTAALALVVLLGMMAGNPAPPVADGAVPPVAVAAEARSPAADRAPALDRTIREARLPVSGYFHRYPARSASLTAPADSVREDLMMLGAAP